MIHDWCVLFVRNMHFKVLFWAWNVVRAAANCCVFSPLRDQLLIWLQQHKHWQARRRGSKYNMMTHGLWRTWMFNMFCMGMFLGNRRIWNLIIWYLISLHWSFPFLKAHVEKIAHLRSPSCIPGISMSGLVFLRGIYETVDPSMELQRWNAKFWTIFFHFCEVNPIDLHYPPLDCEVLGYLYDKARWYLFECICCRTQDAFTAGNSHHMQLGTLVYPLNLWRKQVQFEGFFSNSSRLPFSNGWIWDSLFYEPSGILSKWRMPGFRDSNVFKKSSNVKDFLMFLYLLFAWILQFLHRCFAMKASRKNSALLGASFPSWVSWFHTWDFLVCLHWSLSWSLG